MRTLALAAVALATVVLLAIAAAAWVATAQDVRVERDVAYVESPHPEQRLDFYYPAKHPEATVLFIHGGGLTEVGERRSSPVYQNVCQPFVAAGIACASMDYRLSPSFQWPAMPDDVADAVRALRGLVRERGGDPQRLFLFGHSSGCHLAAVLGTNPTYLGTVGLSPADVAGMVLMGCTLDHHDAAVRGVTLEDFRAPFARDRDYVTLYGTPENWIAANPAHHVGPHVPPTLVVVARAERFHPAILEQGARFVRLLLDAEVPADLVIVPGSHLGSIGNLSKPKDPTFDAIRRFIADPLAAGRDQ